MIGQVAHGFTALLRAGQFAMAGERYWDAEVASLDPFDFADGAAAVARGIVDVRVKHARCFGLGSVEDISIDGPFINGDRFALFMDMMIARAGRRHPHSRIAVYWVRGDKIVEERYFYG